MKIERDINSNYHYSIPLAANEVSLNGEWSIEKEFAKSQSDAAQLNLDFKAGRVYLVLGGKSALPIEIKLDGKSLSKRYWTKDMNARGEIEVKEPKKYDIVDLNGELGRHLLTLIVPKGIQAYAFTFGVEEIENKKEN